MDPNPERPVEADANVPVTCQVDRACVVTLKDMLQGRLRSEKIEKRQEWLTLAGHGAEVRKFLEEPCVLQ